MKKFYLFPLLVFSLLITVFTVSCTNEFSNRPTVIISDLSIEFSELGQTHTLTASIYASEEENPTVQWSSSNESVATCENGVVTAVGYGVCVVRASIEGTSASCTVSIPSPNPTLSISDSYVNLTKIGEKRLLTATSDDGTNISSSVIWASSNEKIATCKNGVVESVGYGVCTVSAFYKNRSVACAVEVVDPDSPSIVLSEDEINLDVGASHTLFAIKKNNAGDVVEWISSDETVATCENGKITAVGDGVCIIIAVTENGFSDFCYVTAGDYKEPPLPEDMLEFDFIDVGEELQFVNGTNGQVISKSVVVSYTFDYETYEEDPSCILVKIKFNCVKIYDAQGKDGYSPLYFKANMFKERHVLGDYQIFSTSTVKIGEPYTFSFSDFAIRLSQSEKREFYMTFDKVTES